MGGPVRHSWWLLGALAWATLAPPSMGPTLPAAADGPDAACTLDAPQLVCNRWASRVPFGPANEVHIAVNPLNAQHWLVVAKDYGLGANGDCRPNGQFHAASASYATFDGGATWAVSRVPAPYPNGGAAPSPLLFRCGSDPVAVFGPDGTAYYVLLNFQYTGGRQASIAVARSPDGGVTWPAEEIRVLHTAGGDDKEWGAADSAGRVHVVWTDTGSGSIFYARSDVNFNFEAPRVIGTAGGGNPAVVVAAGVGSDVYVLWRDGGALRFRRSLDGGATFDAVRTILNVAPFESNGPPRLPFMPQLAADANAASAFTGSVYVVWPGAAAGGSIFAARSTDRGATWTGPIRVDDDPLPNRRQVMPTLSVAPSGRVDVAWLDQRLDPLGQPDTGTYAAFVAHSMDGAATWSANRLVTQVPLVASWSKHQDGSVFIGDYMGIASTVDHALPAFPGNGVDRLQLGLPPERFQRADAYVGIVSPEADPRERSAAAIPHAAGGGEPAAFALSD